MAKKYYTVDDICDLKELLCNVVYDHSENVAFYEKVEGNYLPVTYRKFMGDVFALGTALSDMGLSDKNIMILGRSSYAWALSYMSVVCGLGVAVPVDFRLTDNEISEIAERANISAVLCADDLADKALSLGVTCITFDKLQELVDKGNEIILAGNTSYIESVTDENSLCTLFYTSGTTGAPKGIMLSQKNICFAVCEFRRMVRITSKDVFLSVLPLHHVYECVLGLLAPISCGAAVAFGEGLSSLAHNMREICPTKLFCAPAILEAIYNKLWAILSKHNVDGKVISAVKLNSIAKKLGIDLSHRIFSEIYGLFGGRLDLAIVGGGPISPDILMGLREVGIKAIRCYGLTECAGLAATNRDSLYCDSSEGLPTPSGIVDVYNVTEDGIGEIRYKSAGVMLGYYKDPARTAECLRAGWLYTGDLGYFDDKGFLHVIGRKENVIFAEDGKKVYPEQIETMLGANPYIKEIAVVGIANGRKMDIIAAIVPDRKTFASVYGENFTDYQLCFELEHAIDAVNASLRAYKQIDTYVLCDDPFPKTASKKIIRSKITDSIIDKYNRSK